MNIFNKVTLQYLKKNKTRTVVTIIGIVLSTAMICAVTTFASSIYNYILENAIYNYGDWHGSALDSQWSVYEEIKDSDEVEHVVFAQQLGYAFAEGCVNENKPYLYILGTGEGFEEVMPVHITAGRYPTSTSEILLPNHLASNGEVKHQIGDVLTLEIGNRVYEGYFMWQNNPFYTWDENGETIPIGEELVVRETRTYTVVGFYERPNFEEYTAPGYTALTIADVIPSAYNSSSFNLESNHETSETENYLYSAWFKMKNAKEFYGFFNAILKEHGSSGDRNSSVLIYSGASSITGVHAMVNGLATVVIGLIMFGSVSLIYNAFAISVSERTKQFGLLSSIGGTKKQLRNMVLFEALSVSCIGIPLGILAGVGGIGITLLAIGNKFMSLGSFQIPMRVCVSWIAIVIAIVVALVTVLISAWIPSKRAMKVSAVEAIRQNYDIISGKEKGSGLSSWISKCMYRLFGFSGMIAEKYYRRSRKKYRATILSLFMSIVLFVSASAFTKYLMESATGGFYVDTFDIIYYSEEQDFEDTGKNEKELLSLLKEAKSVTNVAYANAYAFTSEIHTSYLTTQALEHIQLLASQGQPEEGDAYLADMNVIVTFVNDEAFLELLEENKLDAKDFMNLENPQAVVVDQFVRFDSIQQKYVEMDVLESDTGEIGITYIKNYDGYYYDEQVEDENGNLFYRFVSEENAEDFFDVSVDEVFYTTMLKSGKTIDEHPYFASHRGNVVFIYPESVMIAVFPYKYFSTPNYYFTSDNHAESFVDLEKILQENGMNRDYALFDAAEDAEQERNIVAIIQVFSYGFIILISLIAAANVFNTISTNIILRRRDFAMLKSVGMTEKGFRQMMNFECLLYGTKALLYGLPVSMGITYLIYNAVTEGYETRFQLPWTAMGVSVLSVFTVVFVTMMYAMSKIKKENVIDALKNENL